MTAASKFSTSSIKEHARKKGMWAGALTRIAIPDLLGAVKNDAAATADDSTSDDNSSDAGSAAGRAALEIVEITQPHTPALLKILDEIIVNATDHAKEHERGPAARRVTTIRISFSRATGEVAVYNDGPGVPVVVNEAETARAGHAVYTPEIAFSYFLAGTNIDKELANVKGGINGLGAKLTAVHSTSFQVETVDQGTRLYYRQRWLDRLDVREPPQLVDLRRRHDLAPDQARPHTEVRFTPAYAELGYAVSSAASSAVSSAASSAAASAASSAATPLSEADASDLDAWLRLRAHQAAAYAGAKVAVEYNGERCATTDAGLLGRLLAGDEAAGALVITAQAKAAEEPYSLHPWNLAAVILPPGKRAGRRAAAQNMTVVNGVLSNKGSHVQYIKGLLSEAVEERLRKATKRTAVRKPAAGAKPEEPKMSVAETLAGVRLVMCAAIPGADWGGQRKDELQVPRETLRRYAIPDAFLKRVGEAAAERILVAQGAKTGRVVHEKYIRARHAGKAARRSTYLMAAEGDSAITLLRAGLTQTRRAAEPGSPTLDWCGIISLQGVILNAAREVKELETADGATINVRSAKLQDNKRLLALADAFGLRYDRTYATPEELATLNYGQLLLCVDQDLDGTGKIAALVLVWIWLFWPALFRAGRVGRLVTPLIRAYPRRGAGAPAEFATEEEFAHWLAAEPGRAEAHTIKYYKGLAGHDRDEVRRMFAPEAFRKSIYTYTLDDGAKELFNVYFGADPAARKRVLVTPVRQLTYEEALALHELRQIPVGRVQLDIDTKTYKNDAIKRQLPGAVDGLNPARRKIIAGAIRRFAGETAGKELRVFQLGGYVADQMFYHHGDASLNSTVVYLAKDGASGRAYPYLVGVGQFGSRHGDKAGSARYISVRLSPLTRALLPPADRWHLPHVYEDGQMAEPRYYVPVVPMAALESYEIVSEGWNHDSFGRDLDAVLAVVEAYVAGDPALTAAAERLRAEGFAAAAGDVERAAAAWPLPASRRGRGGEIRPYRGEDYSFGRYAWDARTSTVRVTDLPAGVVTATYLASLAKPGRAEHIADIADACGEDTVDLSIVLKPGAFEAITAAGYGDEEIDPLEDFLMLRASLRPHLNYYSADGGVLELGGKTWGYLAAILYWAPYRRDLYRTRAERERIVAELRIVEETEIIRYIGVAAELDLARVRDDAVAAAALRARGFPVLDTALLHSPRYTPNADLRRLVTEGPGACYDYILNLRERDLVLTAVEKRRSALEAARRDLATATAQLAERPVACASVWRAEIADFRAVVAQGIATGWKFK